MSGLVLRDYQRKGVEFLLSQPFGLPHALLADAPGTGKTAMAIEAAKQANCKTGIILVPAVIKEQWRREMIKWDLDGEDAMQVVYGRDAKIDNRPWVIINYELVREKEIRQQLFDRKWHMLVEDEAHRLKNHTSQQSKAVFDKTYGIGHSCYWKWPMSGSIMPNRPAELFPILLTHFPQVLGEYNTWDKYKDRYCGGAWAMGKGATHIDELTERIQPVMLRRELEDVWAECPPVIENEVWLDVPFEKHPDWIGADFLNESAQRRIVAEAKIPQVVAYLKQRLDDGEAKLTVITYHRAVTEGIEAALSAYNPLKIYGGISPKQREISLAKFEQDPRHRLMILQIMSAGEGVDGIQHVCAEYVLAEPEWSYGREDQAGRRILRLGQTEKIVIETKLRAARSFEEVIHYANLRKRKVIDVVLKPNGGSFVMGLLETIDAKLDAILAKLNTPGAAAVPNLHLVPPALPVAASAPVAHAPIALPTVPAPMAPPPVMMAAVAPPAPPAPIAAVAPPAPIAPPVATAAVAAPAVTFGPFNTRKEFEDYVFASLQPLGGVNGPAKLHQLLTTFGVAKLHEMPDGHIPNFLQHLQAALAA